MARRSLSKDACEPTDYDRAQLGRRILSPILRSGTRRYAPLRRLSCRLGRLRRLEPGPELRAVERRVLEQDPELTVVQRGDIPLALKVVSDELVGRAAELAWLVEAWERARHGRGDLRVILGPPDSGRTRLVAQLAARGRGRQRGRSLRLRPSSRPSSRDSRTERTSRRTVSSVVTPSEVDAMSRSVSRSRYGAGTGLPRRSTTPRRHRRAGPRVPDERAWLTTAPAQQLRPWVRRGPGADPESCFRQCVGRRPLRCRPRRRRRRGVRRGGRR